MSGGYFNYKQDGIIEICQSIERIIEHNECGIEPEIIDRFRDATKALAVAYVYAQNIDLLLSYDNGPESFMLALDCGLMALEVTR
jgi:hypothetical protein